MESVEAPVVDAPVEQAADVSEASPGAGDIVDHSTRTAPPEGEAAPEDSEGAEPADAPETYEVKVDGKVEQVSLDDLKKNYSAGAAAQRRFQEAARTKQEAQQTLAKVEHALRADPARVIQQLGPQGVEAAIFGLMEMQDPMVQEAITRAVQASQAAPEVKRQRQLERELEQERQARQQMETEHQQRQRAVETRKIEQRFAELSGPALEAAGLPVSDVTRAELAGLYMNAMGSEPIGPETLAQAARMLANDRLPQVSGAYLQNMSPEQLAEVIGKEKLAAISQARIAEVQQKQSAPPVAKPRPSSSNGQSGPVSLESIKRERQMRRLKRV